tara:strand:- start:68 stop:796 length:729 start_codon:yes stop_codon:yes gene_type:complete
MNMAKAASKTEEDLSYHSLRFERKFIFEGMLLEDILANVVLCNPFCFKEIFHRRTVNNIYFDDQNMSFYRQNVAGDANREKYRLRWYGDDFTQVSNPTFEIKKKYGETGDKYSYKLKGASFDLKKTKALGAQEIIEAQLLAEENLTLYNNLRQLEPALYNTYERRYFLSHCERFRITLDNNMGFYNTKADAFLNTSVKADDIVLELKYERAHDDESRDLTQYFPVRLSKNSKYVRGIDLFNR